MTSLPTYRPRHSRSDRSTRARRGVAALAVMSIALTGAIAVYAVLAAPASAASSSRQQTVAAAARYGLSRGYHVGVSVLDTKTGQLYGAGGHDKTFASESVVKVMIASRLFVQGRMHGATKARAYKMITQSDDAIASSFYGSVGGDSLITWVKHHFHVPSLGSPPHRSGWWGNTHITPDGLVRLYAKLKANKQIGHWLLNTMHDAHKYGSDGFYQWFGLHSANPNAAIKQGWGTDYDDWSNSADENSTGYVDGDRYAVAILARGPVSTYGSEIGAMITRTARILLPGGQFPGGTPTVTRLSHVTGRTAGGARVLIHGHDLDHATAVWFGGHRARGLDVRSPALLSVLSPPHAAGLATVRVTTKHGKSAVRGPRYHYIGIPRVGTISPDTAPVGKTITVGGHNLTDVQGVTFGSAKATSWTETSWHSLQVVVPDHAPGVVHIRVRTSYGNAANRPVGTFTYPATGTPGG